MSTVICGQCCQTPGRVVLVYCRHCSRCDFFCVHECQSTRLLDGYQTFKLVIDLRFNRFLSELIRVFSQTVITVQSDCLKIEVLQTKQALVLNSFSPPFFWEGNNLNWVAATRHYFALIEQRWSDRMPSTLYYFITIIVANKRIIYLF